jgi:DNA-nicking Smr family endonuclease
MAKRDPGNPFSVLKDLKIKKKKPAVPAPPPEPAAKAETEEDIFSQAMLGVDRLANQGGRQVTPPPPPPTPPEAGAADREVTATLAKFVQGELDFELESTDEYLLGHVRGLDAKLVRQLKAGTLSIEAHLDLHGLNASQAYDALLFFLRESYLQGRRVVLLVPGRGKGSPLGLGVLKQEVQHWLTREPLRRIVLAFCTALPRHGGAGALYVLLRKQKKTQGKIKWNREALYGEDLGF